MESNVSPVQERQRHVILDALRGFALMGIVMANFPEFSLYSFLPSETAAGMATAGADIVTRYFLAIFIDGKFYTIFSLLFGIGFSIILNNVSSRGGNGYRVFYRRMFWLLVIGLLHLFFVWSGDILMLYALVGMVLPLFTRLSDRALLWWAGFFLFLPVAVDFVCQWCGMSLASPLVERQWILCDKFGITADNFAYWLRDARTYPDMFRFLIMGSVERMSEFVDGNRYFKVLGLFIIGYAIGRHRLYARIEEFRSTVKVIARLGWLVGFPLSVFYGWSAVNSHPWGLGAHSALYFSSVYLMSFGYVATMALIYLQHREAVAFRILALPGRMALTNYIGQSVAGVFIFYGLGLGFGATTGLVWVEVIAVGVFASEILLSSLWLSCCRFGPLEWVWRCLTYVRMFPLFRR